MAEPISANVRVCHRGRALEAEAAEATSRLLFCDIDTFARVLALARSLGLRLLVSLLHVLHPKLLVRLQGEDCLPQLVLQLKVTELSLWCCVREKWTGSDSHTGMQTTKSFKGTTREPVGFHWNVGLPL